MGPAGLVVILNVAAAALSALVVVLAAVEMHALRDVTAAFHSDAATFLLAAPLVAALMPATDADQADDAADRDPWDTPRGWSAYDHLHDRLKVLARRLEQRAAAQDDRPADGG